jgi:hypothetical protein
MVAWAACQHFMHDEVFGGRKSDLRVTDCDHNGPFDGLTLIGGE